MTLQKLSFRKTTRCLCGARESAQEGISCQHGKRLCNLSREPIFNVLHRELRGVINACRTYSTEPNLKFKLSA